MAVIKTNAYGKAPNGEIYDFSGNTINQKKGLKWEEIRNVGINVAINPAKLAAKIPMENIVIDVKNRLFRYTITNKGVDYMYIGSALND